MKLISYSIFLFAIMQNAPKSEYIFESAPFASCHASTVIELRNGDIMAAWFGGSAEGKPDVAIWSSRRQGSQWSAPAELVREPDIACYNPVLFRTQDGRLWLYYKFGPHPTSWTAGRRFSIDDGKTWSAIEHLPAGIYGPVRAKPLILPDGSIVSGTSAESYRSWACWIERSTDGGRNWVKHGPITVPASAGRPETRGEALAAVPGSSEWAFTDGIIQPSVVSLGANHLRLYARSTSRTGKICIADSFDNGLTWTQARPIGLPNPNSGLDAVALRDGRIVLVYNHSTQSRTPLNLAVSGDGEHFRMFYILEGNPGEYSYPAIIQGSGGELHITYTSNRQRIRYFQIPLSAVPK